MQKLIDFQEKTLHIGTVFRLPGVSYPYEYIVDFMLIDLDGELQLCVSSGYKTGAVRQVLPKEAYAEQQYAISTKWMIENWNKWIYLECKAEEVFILPQGYKIPSLIQKPNIPKYQRKKNLLKYNDKIMFYGKIFRFPAKEPYEEIVDFMLLDNIYTMELLVLSGKHCGKIVFVFPKQAEFKGKFCGIKTNWVIKNWRKIYPDCAARDVFILRKNYIEQVIN